MFIYICISLVRIVSLFSSFLFHFIFKIPKKFLNLNLSHNLNTNAKIQELQHEMHVLIFFICYLINMFPLTEYAQRKGNQIIPKTLLYTYLFILLFLPYTNFRTLQSPLTNGLRTSSGERNLRHQHHGVMRTSNPTSVGRRGPVKRSMPPDHPSLVPEVHPVEASGHWTTSSMPSARITRICATPCGTIETSSIPSGMADRSSLYHLPHHEEGLASPAASAAERGRGGAFPRIDGEVNVIFGGHGSQENRRQQKLNDR
jgi:hypothetical protein